MDIYTRKFELIEDSLQKLSAIRRENPSLDQYRNSWKDRDAAERNLQKIIEAFIDVGKMIIAEKRFREPGNNREVFLILAEKKIFSSEFMTLVDKMIGMRNIIVHGYDRINDEIVYGVLKRNLKDIKKLIANLKKIYRAKG
ncbi:MAG: DUF86 domain-containing protein [Deltaproteobacteria bacterium]|jgi:uncharacterized protein YutE (UPF0331/DUF86 family)|nr:DUF86 domain-containing protein [Deltaproteobacteria bacterium]